MATAEEMFPEVAQRVVIMRVVREVASENPAIAAWRQTHEIRLRSRGSQGGLHDSGVIARARALAADKIPGGEVENIVEWHLDERGRFVGSRYVYGELG